MDLDDSPKSLQFQNYFLYFLNSYLYEVIFSPPTIPSLPLPPPKKGKKQAYQRDLEKLRSNRSELAT